MAAEKGITLVEIVVVLFMIVLFSLILIPNFPAIQQQLSLARASYELAQDLTRTQNLSLSGVTITVAGQPVAIAGYGIYINTTQWAGALDASVANSKQYVIYADNCEDNQYTPSSDSCNGGDDVVSTIKMWSENYGVSITGISGTSGTGLNCISGPAASMDFIPPNPTTIIQSSSSVPACEQINITLSLDSNPSQYKTVSINTAGLIQVR